MYARYIGEVPLAIGGAVWGRREECAEAGDPVNIPPERMKRMRSTGLAAFGMLGHPGRLACSEGGERLMVLLQLVEKSV